MDTDHTVGAPETSAADAVVATLRANGVDILFGLPGSTEAPLLEALRADGTIRYVLSLQESATVAMADGYARASGRTAVVGLHTSVGSMNGLSQLYNAARDGVPVAVTAGHKDAAVQSEDGFCALPDLPGLARNFVKWSWQSMSAAAVPGDVRRALHVAAAPPAGPTYLALPEDLLSAALEHASSPLAYALEHGGQLRTRPDANAVDAAARLLLDARRPVLVLGSAAAASAAGARALAGALEVPVFAADRTQIAELPYPVRDARYCGLYGDDPSLLADADCLLVVAARLFYPFSAQARPSLPPDAALIHAHADPAEIGRGVTPAAALCGTPAAVLDDLRSAIDALGGLRPQQRAERIARLAALRERIAETRRREREAADAAARDRRRRAVSLARLSEAIGSVLPEDALIFDEAVSSSRIFLRHTPFPDGARVFRTTGGALGWGVPAAIGAKIAAPGRPVLAVVGDGSFHFTPQALWTSARERAPVVTVVVDNGGYLAVKRALERHLAVPEDPHEHAGTALPALDTVSVARGYGAAAFVVDDADALAPAVSAALQAAHSTIIVVPVPEAR